MKGDIPLLETKSLSKIFDAGEDSIQPLQSIDFVATSGNFIAIMGPSGSGKTTLLNIMAGLDKPTNGKVLFEGKDVVTMSEKELTQFRRHSLGFVFQSFMLMPLLSPKVLVIPMPAYTITVIKRKTRIFENPCKPEMSKNVAILTC